LNFGSKNAYPLLNQTQNIIKKKLKKQSFRFQKEGKRLRNLQQIHGNANEHVGLFFSI
jgi:hypothetical protein